MTKITFFIINQAFLKGPYAYEIGWNCTCGAHNRKEENIGVVIECKYCNHKFLLSCSESPFKITFEELIED